MKQQKSKKKKLTLKDLQILVDELNEVSGLTGDDCYILTEHEGYLIGQGVIVPDLRLRQKRVLRQEKHKKQHWKRESHGRGHSWQILTSMIHAIQVASQSPKRTQ
jgi:hypothetical protein